MKKGLFRLQGQNRWQHLWQRQPWKWAGLLLGPRHVGCVGHFFGLLGPSVFRIDFLTTPWSQEWVKQAAPFVGTLAPEMPLLGSRVPGTCGAWAIFGLSGPVGFRAHCPTTLCCWK